AAAPPVPRAGSPLLADRPQGDLERPRRALLVRDVPDGVGDRRRTREELLRPGGEGLARPRHVDHRVDDHVGDVDALRSEAPRHRLREDALRRLRRREGREGRRPSPRAPPPGVSMRGTSACRRSISDRTLVRTVRSRSGGETSRNSPSWPATALWTTPPGVPSSDPTRSPPRATPAASVTSTG